MIKMNCGPVSANSQRHSTVDTSTTAAELKEAFLLSNDICGIRNMMQELGLELPGPTVIYEDNSPSISIIEGERSMAATTRSLEINLWKLRERSDMQLVELVFCRTYDQLAGASLWDTRMERAVQVHSHCRNIDAQRSGFEGSRQSKSA